MLFDDPTNTLVWKPFYIQVIRLWWSGTPKSEIAALLGLAPTTVAKAIESERGQQILAQLEGNTFESMLEVQTIAQAASPEMIREKIKLALYGTTEAIRGKNASDVLAIAGHVPLLKVSVSRPDPLLDKYKDKTELDLRKELLAIKGAGGGGEGSSEAGSEPGNEPPERGPDGNLVN